jgi:GGDEF domain-containing protein
MISIRKIATELDRLEELYRTAVACYSSALRSTEQNVVELEASEAASFRSQLQALRARLETAAGAGEMQAVQASFDEELKDYCGKVAGQIRRLRQEVQAAAAAVESFAGSINESEANLEARLNRELDRLNQSAAGADIEKIREAVRRSTAQIAADLQQMRSSNRLAIAQLKDEIRLLHQAVQQARSQAKDYSLESRRRSSGRMEEFIKKNAPFSVLFVVVPNLEGLQNCFSPNILDSALRSFQSRFEDVLPSSALVGRWGRDQFAAILTARPGDALEMSGEVVRKLSGPFLEKENGATHAVVLNPRAGVVEFSPGSDAVKFHAKLKQLAETLSA